VAVEIVVIRITPDRFAEIRNGAVVVTFVAPHETATAQESDVVGVTTISSLKSDMAPS